MIILPRTYATVPKYPDTVYSYDLDKQMTNHYVIRLCTKIVKISESVAPICNNYT